MSNRLNLFIIYSIGMLDHIGLGLVLPIFTLLLFDKSLTFLPLETSEAMRGFWLGLLLALTPFAQFFCAPILGAYSDHHGRKAALQVGMSIAVLGYAVSVLGVLLGNLNLLILSRILVGASDGTVPVAQAAISDISTEEEKAKRFGFFNMCLGIGLAIGPLIGSFVGDSKNSAFFSYADPFILAGAVSLFNLILVAIKFPSMPPSNKKKQYQIFDGLLNLKRALSWKDLRPLFATAFIFYFGWAFFAEFFATYLKQVLNFNIREIGYAYTYNCIFYALSSGLLIRPILKRFNSGSIVCAALLFGAIYFLSFLFVESGMGFLLFIPPLMLTMSLIFTSMTTTISNLAGKARQGEVLGVYHSIFAIAFCLSPLLGGPLAGKYPISIALVASISFFLAWGILNCCHQKSQRSIKTSGDAS